MNNYKGNQSPPPTNNYTYPVSFRIDRYRHSQVEQIVNKTNKWYAIVLRDLINLGLDKYFSEHIDVKIDVAKQQLYRDVNNAKERQSILQDLAIIKSQLSPDEFCTRCRENGIDPLEVEEIYPPGITKRDLVRIFLKAIFTDRSEGMPVNRVLEVGSSQHFSENMVREEVRKLGVFSKKRRTHNGVMNIWYPPKEW